MKNRVAITAAWLITWINSASAAQAVIVGEGRVLGVPDYVELSITIDSKCYATAAEARKVNDGAARKIVDFLNSKIQKKDNYNSVVSSGGFTAPYQTFYLEKHFCQNTFQKQNTITFRTQDLAHFETLFDEIQNNVYQQFAHNFPALIDSAISSVTMSSPQPGISDNLRNELELKAIHLAYLNATGKLSALFSANKIQNVMVTYASEVEPQDARTPIQSHMVPMAMMSGARNAKAMIQAPVQFDEETISKSIYFTFNFDNIDLLLK